MLGALGDVHRCLVVNEADHVAPALPLAGTVVAAEALDSMEQPAEVDRATIREGGRLGKTLPPAPAMRRGSPEEAAVVEEEGVGVSGGGAGEEAVDGLPLGGEGEGGEVEGVRRGP